VATSERK